MMTLKPFLIAAAALSLTVGHAAPVLAQSRPGPEMASGLAGLQGPVSGRVQQQLDSGERVPVIVTLDIPVDLAVQRADHGPAGDAMRRRIADLQNALLTEVYGASARASEQSRQGLGYQPFRVTPGFAILANQAEIVRLASDPRVLRVREDRIMRPATDTSMGQIGADNVWARGVEGANVSVAILDTGIESRHTMVRDNIAASACFNSTLSTANLTATTTCPNGLDQQLAESSADAATACLDADYFDVASAVDGCVHGTHVASTAAGSTVTLKSGAGVSGVAPSSEIIAVNVFSRFDRDTCTVDGEPRAEHECVQSFSSDQIAALEWLLDNRDRYNLAAVNMSLGSDGFTEPCLGTDYEVIMQELTDAGVAVVVAAGNDGFANKISEPARVPSAISVGAVNDNDVVAGFSNDADFLDLLAPGVDILAALLTEEPPQNQNCQLVPDTEPNEDGVCHWYGELQGTSMAAPHVAGAFALLYQGFPSTSVAQRLTALQVTGEPVMDGYTQRVHARIQVDAAYDFLANGAGVVRSVSLDSLTRFDARNTSSDVASFNSTTRAIRNASGQSRTVRVVSKPDWLTTEFYEGDGAPSGAPVSQTALTLISDGQLRLRVNGIGLSDGFNKGELVLSVDGSSTRIRLKVTALVTTPVELDYETVRFGPFEWVGDADESVGSIFRLVGLDSGLPVALSADIERWGARDGRTVTDASIQCDFVVRPERFSGNEYIIGAADFTDCPRFDRADVFIDARVARADAAGLRMRRFLFNRSGGITDAAYDPSGGAGMAQSLMARAPVREADAGRPALYAEMGPGSVLAPEALTQAEFGVFEWTHDGTGALLSEFRLGPVIRGDDITIDVALINASSSGYDGAFTDCRLTIRPARRGENDLLITSQDLTEDCGAFGRADVLFRVTADSSRVNYALGDIDNMRMQRQIRQDTGALTDFHLDGAVSTGVTATNLGNGSGQVIAGPFEWTGDSSAPTSNQFRIAGVTNGAVSRIDVSIANATASGYAGDFNDCSLTIRPQRAGARDYIILREDLADCGAFGRGDLSFRIQAPLSAFPAAVKVRRLAFGADGDITDFGFDAEAGAGQTPTAISGGREEVVFGPFEWVGDAQAGTRGVFRITGIVGGLPDSIDIAIANATAGNGQFTGAYSDCSLTLRPGRAGLNEFVIGAADFIDCGGFGRGDLSFRIRADAAVLADTVRMRRFAVTTAGGLTDFGFDND